MAKSALSFGLRHEIDEQLVPERAMFTQTQMAGNSMNTPHNGIALLFGCSCPQTERPIASCKQVFAVLHV